MPCWVERDAHLLELCRYVVLNPARAGLVGRAEDGAGAAIQRPRGWAAARSISASTGCSASSAVAAGPPWWAYVAFVAEGEDLIWDHLKAQIYLGNDDFVAEMKARIEAADALIDVPRQQRLPAPKPLTRYESETSNRDAAMAAASAGGHTLRAIARHFAVHESTVSRAVRRQEDPPDARMQDLTPTDGCDPRDA